MFNKAPNRQNMRKRKQEEEEEDQQSGSAVVRKEKKLAGGALSASTAGTKKKVEDAFYESARTVVPTIGKDNNAVTIDEEEEREMPAGGGPAKESGSGPVYKGAANYQKFIEKRDVLDRKATSIGPIKAPTNVRLTCRFDYQRDICKDYKETGYCTFGDACKFMHDRGDYKAGWELDRDWEAEQEKKRMDAALAEMEGQPQKKEEEDDGLPFACAICRGPFKSPVETKCGHYFCEGCALAHYAKNRRCFLCNEQTFGSFNTATKLVAKIKKLKGKTEDDEGGAAGKTEEEQYDSEIAGSGWTESRFKADRGWAIPGNTFSEGKEI